MSKSTQEKQIAKAKGKTPVFLDPPEYPTHLSLVQFDDYSNPQAERRRSDELKYLANVFDAIKDLKDVLHDHPGWDYIWQVLIEPIDKAAKIASDVAVDEAHDPKSRNVTNEVKKVRDLCTVVHHKTLNDPCNGYGIITNLVHVLTLAETVRLQDYGFLDKAQWNQSIFAASRCIWARIDRLLPRVKPSTIGCTQEIDLFGSIGPPVFAVNVSGNAQEREFIRRVRLFPFSVLDMKTEGTGSENEDHWGGRSCSESQNWLILAPALMNAPMRTQRRFFASSTFKVNDVWRQSESTLFQNVVPFCGNCRALAESLTEYGIFIMDGALDRSPNDLREWVQKRSLRS